MASLPHPATSEKTKAAQNVRAALGIICHAMLF
jgi:hypothetical protein